MRLNLIKFNKALRAVLGLGIWGLSTLALSAQEPTPAEMWALIQAQQAEIGELRQAVAALQGEAAATTERTVATERAVVETQENLAATVEAVESGLVGTGSGTTAAQRTHLGGYGELHLNFAGGGADSMIDFHRWVLFVNHDFSDSVRLFSEFELEHSLAGDGAPGEVELEQAFIQFDLSEMTSANVGLFLMPVGLLNETHEPNTFFGVERNKVEARIIPTTWWEAGLGVTHRTASGWSFDGFVTSGLDNGDGVIRSGRQKVAEAIAESGIVGGRARFSGIPGVLLGTTLLYQGDLDQSSVGSTDAFLFEAHADIRRGPFGLRALYAQWWLGGDNIAETAKEQLGYYIEPSYRFDTAAGEMGVFVRFSHYEYQRNATAFRSDDLFETGINYWPVSNVVLKADYQYTAESEELAGDHWFNLGMGYQF